MIVGINLLERVATMTFSTDELRNLELKFKEELFKDFYSPDLSYLFYLLIHRIKTRSMH
jgi:hypothetical protein